MRIGFDLSITNVNQAGTSIYAQNLVKALQQLDTQDQYLSFAVNQHRKMGETKTWRSRLATIYRDLVWTHMVLPKQVAGKGIDLLHMPANIVPVYSPCRTVVFIHDTIVFESPEKFPV